MALATNLGFPRIGPDRELKKAVEAYWAGRVGSEDLLATARSAENPNWSPAPCFGTSSDRATPCEVMEVCHSQYLRCRYRI